MSDNNNNILASKENEKDENKQEPEIKIDATLNEKINIKDIFNNIKSSSLVDIFLPITYMGYGIKALLIIKDFKLPYILFINLCIHLIFLILSFLKITRVNLFSIIISLIISILFYGFLIIWRRFKSKFKFNKFNNLNLNPINIKYNKIYKSEKLTNLEKRYK